MNSIGLVREFLHAQLGWVSEDLFGDDFRPAAAAILTDTKTAQASLLRVGEDWVFSLSVDGRLGESPRQLLRVLESSEYLQRVPGKDTHRFTFADEFRQRHKLPEGLGLSISDDRVRILLGPISAFPGVFDTWIQRSDAIIDVSGNLSTLWSDDSSSVLSPRDVMSLGERLLHERFVGRHLGADPNLGKPNSPDAVLSREIFVHSMEFDSKHHCLFHLLTEEASQFRLRADPLKNGWRLRVTVGRDIVDAIEVREAMVKQAVLADIAARFQGLSAAQLLDQLETAGRKVPTGLRERIKKKTPSPR